jgi:DNA-binding transcriptional ArsR family regulator
MSGRPEKKSRDAVPLHSCGEKTHHRLSSPKETMPNMAMTGDRLLVQLGALASSHRLRILATLIDRGRQYVSQLARDVGMSRPLLHLHLQKLEDAGLVRSKLELSDDGKALNYFEAADFTINLTPAFVAKAVKSLSAST